MSGLRLETVEVEPRAAADAAVLLMHGLGADGHDFESLVPELRLPASPSVRWVFPHAPVRPVTINGGFRMRAWYDIVALDRSAPEDEAGHPRVRRGHLRPRPPGARAGDRRRADRPRRLLAGRGHGALHGAPLAGAARPASWPSRCYLPLAATLEAEAHPANAAVPVFMAHGTFDPLVPPALGEGSRDLLRSRGHDVEWHTYPMPHSVCADEVQDLRGLAASHASRRSAQLTSVVQSG